MARGVCSPGAACSVLSAVASLVSGRRVQSAGSRAWLPRSMWDPPGSGIESVSPALTGGFLTNGPSGKSSLLFKTCAFLGLFLQPRSLLFLPTAFLNFKKKFLQCGRFSDLWHSPLIFILVSLHSQILLCCHLIAMCDGLNVDL